MADIFGAVVQISPSEYSWSLGTERLPDVCSSEKFSVCGSKYEFYFRLSKTHKYCSGLYLCSLQRVPLKFHMQIVLKYKMGKPVTLPTFFYDSYDFRHLDSINTSHLLEIVCSFSNIQDSIKPGYETGEPVTECVNRWKQIKAMHGINEVPETKNDEVKDKVEEYAKGLNQEKGNMEKTEQQKWKATLKADSRLNITCCVSKIPDSFSPGCDTGEPKVNDPLKENIRMLKQMKENMRKYTEQISTGEPKVEDEMEEYAGSLKNEKQNIKRNELQKCKDETKVKDELGENAGELKEEKENTERNELQKWEDELKVEDETEEYAGSLKNDKQNIKRNELQKCEGETKVKDETRENAGELSEERESTERNELQKWEGETKVNDETTDEDETEENAGEELKEEKENIERNELQKSEDESEVNDEAEENARRLKEEKENFERNELQKWKGFAKLSRDLENAFLNEEDSDVILKVGDQTYPAHKVIIKNRSSVFRAMLEHDMKEKNQGEIEIPDCDPHIFQDFLLYLYSGKLENIPKKCVFELYYMSDKYNVSQLKLDCVDYIRNNLSIDIICDAIALSTKHCESDLLKHAIEFFVKNANDIFVTVEWQEFLKENTTEANELIIKAFKNALSKPEM